MSDLKRIGNSFMLALIIIVHVLSLIPMRSTVEVLNSVCTECDVLNEIAPSHTRSIDPESLNDMLDTYLEFTRGLSSPNTNPEKNLLIAVCVKDIETTS